MTPQPADLPGRWSSLRRLSSGRDYGWGEPQALTNFIWQQETRKRGLGEGRTSASSAPSAGVLTPGRRVRPLPCSAVGRLGRRLVSGAKKHPRRVLGANRVAMPGNLSHLFGLVAHHQCFIDYAMIVPRVKGDRILCRNLLRALGLGRRMR